MKKQTDNNKIFDLPNQNYPQQDTPPEAIPDEIDLTEDVNPIYNKPWFSREPSWHGRDINECREYLSNLSDEELLNQYYEMRDEKVVWDGGYFYPNIKKLYLTPYEREKDRREQAIWQEKYEKSEVVEWYEMAKDKSCVWWLENHLIAKHSFNSCMSCGACAAVCPAAEFYDYDPRLIMETVQSKDEERIVELLKSDTIWYCGQCGSCKQKCSRGNNPFGMISSLRQLSQIKGYHTSSVRGRQQYNARHLWGGNLWNRGCSLYFRNNLIAFHLDFGPRFARYTLHREEIYRRINGSPDMNGIMPGRKISPETLHELRRCCQEGGGLFLWDQIEKYGQEDANAQGIDIDDYFYTV
jgi:heterodisulfide reductase subunit C1